MLSESNIATLSNCCLKNAHIPSCLLESQLTETVYVARDGLSLVNLSIVDGKIIQIEQVNRQNLEEQEEDCSIPTFDLAKKIILPRFVDLHTHLDRAHIWERSPNLTGTFGEALEAVARDQQTYFNPGDVYRRLEFSLQCSYAHGTAAIRTHIDCADEKGKKTLEIFQELQNKWSDRLSLQAVSLVDLKYYQKPEGIILADYLAAKGHILGAFVYNNLNLEQDLENIFTIAQERDLKLDFHVDENGNPNSRCLEAIAKISLKYNYAGKVVCGHCCSLAMQKPEVAQKIISLVKAAQISVVSLPMCNMYLQDRRVDATPFWRGITRIHEMKSQGIEVCFASDNCRDPFFGFGDHDMLEVFNQSVRIAHLDTPHGDWCKSFTTIPARLMGLSEKIIALNCSADFIIFNARYFSELFSRSQGDRMVIKRGEIQDTTLPDYAQLDDLIFFEDSV